MSDPALQLSVVIPTFNRATKLRRALLSLAAQATAPGTFEIIVVDDGSEDETAAVVEQARPELHERTPLRYVPVEHGGPAAARNAGIQQAQSPAILFTDDDCEADHYKVSGGYGFKPNEHFPTSHSRSDSNSITLTQDK